MKKQLLILIPVILLSVVSCTEKPATPLEGGKIINQQIHLNLDQFVSVFFNDKKLNERTNEEEIASYEDLIFGVGLNKNIDNGDGNYIWTVDEYTELRYKSLKESTLNYRLNEGYEYSVTVKAFGMLKSQAEIDLAESNGLNVDEITLYTDVSQSVVDTIVYGVRFNNQIRFTFDYFLLNEFFYVGSSSFTPSEGNIITVDLDNNYGANALDLNIDNLNSPLQGKVIVQFNGSYGNHDLYLDSIPDKYLYISEQLSGLQLIYESPTNVRTVLFAKDDFYNVLTGYFKLFTFNITIPEINTDQDGEFVGTGAFKTQPLFINLNENLFTPSDTINIGD